jgi:hypothetical protein
MIAAKRKAAARQCQIDKKAYTKIGYSHFKQSRNLACQMLT